VKDTSFTFGEITPVGELVAGSTWISNSTYWLWSSSKYASIHTWKRKADGAPGFLHVLKPLICWNCGVL